MTTEKQKQANRENAKKFTGAKTEAGKARSAANSIKHGLFSAKLILHFEKASDFEELQDALRQDWKPQGCTELLLVEKIAVCLWRQKRLHRVEDSQVAEGLTARAMVGNVRAAVFPKKPDYLLDIMQEQANEVRILGLMDGGTKDGKELRGMAEEFAKVSPNQLPPSEGKLADIRITLDRELFKLLDELRKQQTFRFEKPYSSDIEGEFTLV